VSDGGANVSTPAATNQGAQSGTVSGHLILLVLIIISVEIMLV